MFVPQSHTGECQRREKFSYDVTFLLFFFVMTEKDDCFRNIWLSGVRYSLQWAWFFLTSLIWKLWKLNRKTITKTASNFSSQRHKKSLYAIKIIPLIQILKNGNFKFQEISYKSKFLTFPKAEIYWLSHTFRILDRTVFY